MARVIARCVLTFGLVSVDIDSAFEDQSIHMHWLHKSAGRACKSAGLFGVVERDDLVREPRPIRHSPTMMAKSLELLSDREGKHLNHSLVKASGLPLFVGYALRVLQIFLEDLFEPLSDGAIVDRKIDFLIQCKGSIIKISAPDG